MQKLFLRGLFITLVLNLLVKPATIFGVDVEMQNLLGSHDYGVYYALLNFTFLFSMLLDMGVTNFMTRLISQHPHLIRNYSDQLFTLRLVLSGVYFLWSFILFLVIGWDTKWLWLLAALVLHQINMNTVNYVRAYSGGLLRFGLDAVLSVAERLVYFVVGMLALYSHFIATMTIEWFVGLTVGSSFISLLFGLFVYVYLVGVPKWKWNTVFFQAILKKSLPFALLFILMMLTLRLDAVILERIHPDGQRQVSYYVQGFRLLDACWMFGVLFGSLLLPVFSKQLKEKSDVGPIMTNAFNLLIGGGILMIGLSFGTIKPLFDLLYEDVSRVSYQSWTFLALTFIPMCFTIVFGTLLTANGSMKALNIIGAGGLVLSLILHLILAPLWGALGTAIATFTTQLGMGLAQWAVIRISLHHRLEKNAWTKLILLGASIFILLLLNWYYHFGIILWCALVFVTWSVFIFGLKIIDLKKSLSLFTKKND